MTKILLVRHGLNDFIGNRLAGRMKGVHLNQKGLDQARQLVDRLRMENVDRIFSSPLERCQQTAAPFAAAANLKVEIIEAVQEINYGDWTGRAVTDLKGEAEWQRWISFRTSVRIPGGETMLEIQTRMVTALQQLHRDFKNQTIAVFSHGDPIRTAICHYLGIPLDFSLRLEISPASVSQICIDEDSVQVKYVNDLSTSR